MLHRAFFAVVAATASMLALTGVASAAPTAYTTTVSTGGVAGTQDPNVAASYLGTTHNAYNVAANGAWSTIAGTGWESFWQNGGTSTEPTGDYSYATSITLPSNATNASLSGQFYSDNQGFASVNGTPVAQNAACGPGEGAEYGGGGAPPTSFTSPLTSGSNSLSFSVINCPAGAFNPTGIDFTATASYTLSATDKDQCKNGGWQTLTDSNGKSFKNQGDCVSYVATDGRNLADGS